MSCREDFLALEKRLVESTGMVRAALFDIISQGMGWLCGTIMLFATLFSNLGVLRLSGRFWLSTQSVSPNDLPIPLTHLKLFFISRNFAITSMGSVLPVAFRMSGSCQFG